MSGLDLQYIAELVIQAQEVDSNAFAELFAATYQKQFSFACSYLNDPTLAQEALQEGYIYALKNLSKLREPALVVVWLNQITLRACFRIQHRSAILSAEKSAGAGSENPESRMLELGGRQYSVRQIMTLPFSEAQTLLLSRLCGMKTGSIASLLEIRRGTVRRYMDSGRKRLSALSGGREGGKP